MAGLFGFSDVMNRLPQLAQTGLGTPKQTLSGADIVQPQMKPTPELWNKMATGPMWGKLSASPLLKRGFNQFGYNFPGVSMGNTMPVNQQFNSQAPQYPAGNIVPVAPTATQTQPITSQGLGGGFPQDYSALINLLKQLGLNQGFGQRVSQQGLGSIIPRGFSSLTALGIPNFLEQSRYRLF